MQSREQLHRLAELLGGLPVFGCLPGSAAHRAGIRYGDIVLSVNGRATSSQQAYVEARDSIRDRAEVVVFRGGTERRFTLDLTVGRPLLPADVLGQLRGARGSSDSGTWGALPH